MQTERRLKQLNLKQKEGTKWKSKKAEARPVSFGLCMLHAPDLLSRTEASNGTISVLGAQRRRVSALERDTDFACGLHDFGAESDTFSLVVGVETVEGGLVPTYTRRECVIRDRGVVWVDWESFSRYPAHINSEDSVHGDGG